MDTKHTRSAAYTLEIAAYTQLRALNQGNKTLSMYIQEVRRLVDLYNLDCNADRDKVIRNSIIAGINSTKAYQQCISKGSSLSLEDFIKIYQMEDATCRQVQALCPESSDCNDSTPISQDFKPASVPVPVPLRQRRLQQLQGQRWAPQGQETLLRATGPDPGKTTSTVQLLYLNTVGEPHTTPGKNAEP